MPDKQLKKALTMDEGVERELAKIIALDDAARFKEFLAQGMPTNHHFSGYCMEPGDMELSSKSLAEAVVIRNALRIGEVLFDVQDIQAQFEYKAAVGYAAVFGTADMIRFMVAKGFDPNKKRYTAPPLLLAVIQGSLDRCAALLASGNCNPYAKDQYHIVDRESRPLCEAARQGRLDIVRLIVECKKDNKALARSALVAAENGHEGVALYLLDQLDAGRKKGSTHSYPYHIIIPAAEQRLMAIVDRLLDAEPRTLHLVNNNATPLSAACKRGHTELAARLVSMGADVHAAEDSKYLVYTGKEFMACSSEELWESAYDPPPGAFDMKISLPLRSQSPSSPLAEAAASGHLAMVKMLVECGVDPETAFVKCSRPDLTPSLMYRVPAMELARHLGHTAVVDYLAALRGTVAS